MVKSTLQTLLAMATIACLSIAAAADEDSTLPSQLPVAPATSSTTTAGQEITSDRSLFNDDGWQSGPVAQSNDHSCLEGCPSCDSASCDNCGKRRKITADVELMALRTHFSDTVVGKIGEKYELSERITLGIERPNGIGGRIRYWTYDRTTPNLAGGSKLRADFDVTDLEGTTRFGNENFDLMITGGIRWAEIKIDIDSGRCRNDMPGGSFGLNLRGLICNDCENGLVWRSVSGARFSIFGGDWECSNGLIAPIRDDNLTVMEIYGGVECTGFCHGHEVYARLVFESQNWRSDALGESTGIDSISFIGPGVNLGVNY